MERSEIFNSLKDYLESKLAVDERAESIEINEETVLSKIGVTSVDFVLLLVFAESELDVSFEDDDLLMPNDVSLGELIDRIMNLNKN
jgi:acyl carrier protein